MKVLRFADHTNRRGFVPVEYIGEGCTGCAICFYNCPEFYALEVYIPDKEGRR
jgi:NAD-dependent dihydropyrimidine dehydrogenase PreA subunit